MLGKRGLQVDLGTYQGWLGGRPRQSCGELIREAQTGHREGETEAPSQPPPPVLGLNSPPPKTCQSLIPSLPALTLAPPPRECRCLPLAGPTLDIFLEAFPVSSASLFLGGILSPSLRLPAPRKHASLKPLPADPDALSESSTFLEAGAGQDPSLTATSGLNLNPKLCSPGFHAALPSPTPGL